MLAACEIRIAQRADDDDNLTQPVCGNGIVEGSEVCDDANTADGDGCNAACTSDESCGNGVIDEGVEETCDDGNLLGGDGCSDDCASDETCGNGVIDLAKGETCDDGNLQGGDGCSANCQSNESCGNMVTDSGTDPPEECDAGPTGSAACDVNCTNAFCGDFTVNTLRNETCDAGPNGSAQCDTNCTAAVCGDGTTNALRGEQCDDGNGSTTDACISCKTAFCGDGFVRANVEQCDDANANTTDACTVNCQAAFCGDGFVRAGVEQCDGQPGCGSNCQFTPFSYVLSDSTCDQTTSQCTSSQLIGFGTDCGGLDGVTTNPYDNGCSGNPTGFIWQDQTPFNPSMIVFEVNHGITCDGGVGSQVASTNLNGSPSGDFQLLPNPGGCNCIPTEVLNTWTLTGSQLSGFQRGQTNTLNIAGIINCFGVSFDEGFGGYVRITVYP